MSKAKKKSAGSRGTKDQRPLLSVGIIFKNEIRCLERCLKSLQPLREKIPMEIVMADTGSTDGSREVAAKYADILFDFPWINDFAAARNAVMDRCSGVWYLTVDSDEWLDEDHTELADAVRKLPRDGCSDICTVIQRNYDQIDLRGYYSDMHVTRMTLMASGRRYEGAIHENFPNPQGLYTLNKTILHHDGYAQLSKAHNRAKEERNMTLLRRKLEEDPENLMTVLQCEESSKGAEKEKYLRMGLRMVHEGNEDAQLVGPAMLRNAVVHGTVLELREIEEWAAEALERFQWAQLVRIDINAAMLIQCVEKKDFRRAISHGEGYLAGVEDYHKNGPTSDQLTGACFYMSSPREGQLRILLARAHCEEEQYETAKAVLSAVDLKTLEPACLGGYVALLLDIFSRSQLDAADLLGAIWTELKQMKAGEAEDLRTVVASASLYAFSSERRETEEDKGRRLSYRAYLPFADSWDLGRAAAMLKTEEPAALDALLSQVEDWKVFPIPALAHAIKCGAQLRVPEFSEKEMEILAAGLLLEGGLTLDSCLTPAEGEGMHELSWRHARLNAAMEGFAKLEESEKERGAELARAYAEAEREYLCRIYTPDILAEENNFLLSPVHRFGWYCAAAYAALDGGDRVGYVRMLRSGLTEYKAMKDVVEFLAGHIPAVSCPAPPPSPELLALAEQVKTILSQFAPDDPAVAQLKASPAYQKVAHIIDGAAPTA